MRSIAIDTRRAKSTPLPPGPLMTYVNHPGGPTTPVKQWQWYPVMHGWVVRYCVPWKDYMSLTEVSVWHTKPDIHICTSGYNLTQSLINRPCNPPRTPLCLFPPGVCHCIIGAMRPPPLLPWGERAGLGLGIVAADKPGRRGLSAAVRLTYSWCYKLPPFSHALQQWIPETDWDRKICSSRLSSSVGRGVRWGCALRHLQPLENLCIPYPCGWRGNQPGVQGTQETDWRSRG